MIRIIVCGREYQKMLVYVLDSAAIVISQKKTKYLDQVSNIRTY